MQKFNYHQHTYRCGHADLDMEDEDYIKEYIKMGFKEIAFTDHCPRKDEVDNRPNVRMKYSERNEYLDSINKLKEKYMDKIKIKSGYEIEYLPGEEDNLRELKDETDILVLGQHFVYTDNGDLNIFDNGEVFTDEELIRYAEYIDKAMELNIPDVIAHPDLFMNVRDEFGEVEEKISNMICKSAEKYDIPLELNINKIFKEIYYKGKGIDNLSEEQKKEKLKAARYPCKAFWKIAAKYNVKVIYGLDVHHKGQIPLFNELVKLANDFIGSETINKLNFINKTI